MTTPVKIASVSLSVAVLLILVLVANTFRVRSRQLRVLPVDPIVLDEVQITERFSRALQYKTISHPDPSDLDTEEFVRLHDYLEEAFPNVHSTLKREVIGNYSLLYRWRATESSRQPILLMSHLDVVPVEPETRSQWSYPPFAGRVADGFIWGRGALDIKCGAVALLEAVEYLLKHDFQSARDIYLAFGHDEEVGGRNGNGRIADTLKKRGVKFEYVLDEGGVIVHDVIPGVTHPVAYVAVAEKGYLALKLTAGGTGGHSSMPPPQSAVGVVAEAIHKLESNPFPADLGGLTGQMLDSVGPEMPFAQRLVLANRWLFAPLIKRSFEANPAMNATMRTTTAVTMVGGGVSQNVLPTSAWAVVNFRILPGKTPADVLKHVRSVIDDERVTLEEHAVPSAPSMVSKTESEAFQTLQRTIAEIFPGVIVTPALAVVTTDSTHYENLTEGTFRFIPTRMGSEDLRRPHGIDERIGVANYLEIVRFFVRQIQNSAKAVNTFEEPGS